MPRGGFIAVKPAAKWGLGYEIGIFKALEISQLRNGGMGYEMALVCQRGVSQGFSQLRNGAWAAKLRF